MKKSLLIVSLLALALTACKKEEAPVVAPAPAVEAAPAPAAPAAETPAAVAASAAADADRGDGAVLVVRGRARDTPLGRRPLRAFYLVASAGLFGRLRPAISTF